MAGRRWIAVYDPGLTDYRTGQVRVRFLMSRGYRTYRGMYRNMRRTGTHPPVLTDDLDLALRWRSPSEALSHLAKFYPATQIEKVWRLVYLEEM